MISIEKTSSGLIVSGNTRMVAIILTAGSDAATVVVDDSTDGSGSVLATLKTVANTSRPFTIGHPGIKASDGLYVTITGTDPKVYVVYR